MKREKQVTMEVGEFVEQYLDYGVWSDKVLIEKLWDYPTDEVLTFSRSYNEGNVYNMGYWGSWGIVEA